MKNVFRRANWFAAGCIALLAVGCGSTSEPQPLITDAGLAYLAGHTPRLWLARADGSGAVEVASAGFASGSPDWSPDGMTVAFRTTPANDSSMIETIRADGLGRETVVTGLRSSVDPSWSPSGEELVFAGRPASAEFEDLYIVNRDGSNLRPLAPAGFSDRTPDWSPDGSTIAFTSLREEEPPAGSGSRKRGLYLIDPDGTNVRRLISTFALFIVGPKWSPDGTRLVFEAATGSFDSDIYVLTVATGALQQITSMNDRDSEPTWSPDGSRIAFTRRFSGSGGQAIYSVKTDGTDLQQMAITAYRPSNIEFRPVP